MGKLARAAVPLIICALAGCNSILGIGDVTARDGGTGSVDAAVDASAGDYSLQGGLGAQPVVGDRQVGYEVHGNFMSGARSCTAQLCVEGGLHP